MWGIELKRHSEVSLSRQIYLALREQMTVGQLQSGEALPSTRELAKQLSVSRNTAYEAYEMLSAEGYIVSRRGSQTRVAAGLRLEKKAPVLEEPRQTVPPVQEYQADFRTGQPDLRRFPKHLWLQLLRKATDNFPTENWGYTGPQGLPVLREEIAAWLLGAGDLQFLPRIFLSRQEPHKRSTYWQICCFWKGRKF